MDAILSLSNIARGKTHSETMNELPGNLGIPSSLERKETCTFVFSSIPPSTLQILQRGRWIPNPVQSQKKAVVITIYELSQQTPRSDSVASDLCSITHYTVRTRQKTELLNRFP